MLIRKVRTELRGAYSKPFVKTPEGIIFVEDAVDVYESERLENERNKKWFNETH